MNGMLGEIWNLLEKYPAELIALCALFFTLYQTLATRKHNRLSVKPHLCFFTYKTFKDNETVIKATLHNNGLGPALIKTFQFYLDQEAFDVKDEDDFELQLNKVLESNEYKMDFSRLGEKYAMKAGEERDIVTIQTPITDKEIIKKWLKALERLDLEINFESMYGDKNSYDSRIKNTEGKKI